MAGLVFSSQNPPQNAKKTQGISCPESLFGPLYVADLVRFSRGEYIEIKTNCSCVRIVSQHQ